MPEQAQSKGSSCAPPARASRTRPMIRDFEISEF